MNVENAMSYSINNECLFSMLLKVARIWHKAQEDLVRVLG